MTNSIFPPETFNLSRSAFRPSEIGPSQKGLELLRKVAALQTEGRLRSAMSVIFDALDRDPGDQVALRSAMVVIGTTSRTSGLQAKEPLSHEYLYDTRLDPIFAVCSKCKTSSWVPTNCLIAFDSPETKLFVTSPIGFQCYDCGFVICRKCMPSQYVNIETSVVQNLCVNCEKTDVRPTVYPTGRSPVQFNRRDGMVTQVIIFRHGPVSPGVDYIRELLSKHCPDALKEGARIKVVPVEHWSESMETVARFYVLNLHKEDPTVGYFRGIVEYRDAAGVRGAVVRLCATEV